MTQCSCLQVKDIPSCTGSIIVGTIPDVNQSVTVYIRDVTTSMVQAFSTMSDDNGLIEIDISSKEFPSTHSYELWVTRLNAGYKEKLPITIGYYQNKTICLRFESVKQVDGSPETYSSQTLLSCQE